MANLTSIPTRHHSDLQNLTSNDHPWYTAEPNRLAITTFTQGLDASKSGTPAVGNVYYATDTVKVYICFATNVWTQVDDVCVPHGAAQGDVIYFDGAKWARLAAGTANQVLKTNGAAANPSWATPFGTLLQQNFAVAGGALTQNVDTTIGQLTTVPAVAGTSSIRIRGQITPNNGTTTWKFNAGGSGTITMGLTGASSGLFEIVIVMLNSQTANDYYGQIINGTTVHTFSGTLNGNFSGTWTFNLIGNDTGGGGSCTSDFIDAYTF